MMPGPSSQNRGQESHSVAFLPSVSQVLPMLLGKKPPKVEPHPPTNCNDWSKIFACNGFARHRWNGDGLFRHPENTRDASRLETNLEIKL